MLSPLAFVSLGITFVIVCTISVRLQLDLADIRRRGRGGVSAPTSAAGSSSISSNGSFLALGNSASADTACGMATASEGAGGGGSSTCSSPNLSIPISGAAVSAQSSEGPAWVADPGGEEEPTWEEEPTREGPALGAEPGVEEEPNSEEGPSWEEPSLKEEPVVEEPNREEPTWKGPTWDSWEVSAESILGRAGNPPHVTGSVEAAAGMSWQQPGTVAGAAVPSLGPSTETGAAEEEEEGPAVPSLGLNTEAGAAEKEEEEGLAVPSIGLNTEAGAAEEKEDMPPPVHSLSHNDTSGVCGGSQAPEPLSSPTAESGEGPAAAAAGEEPDGQKDQAEEGLADLKIVDDVIVELFLLPSSTSLAAAHAGLKLNLIKRWEARGGIPLHTKQRALLLASDMFVERWEPGERVQRLVEDRYGEGSSRTPSSVNVCCVVALCQ